MRPLTSSALWKRAPSAGSLLIGVLVGLLVASLLRRGEPAPQQWQGSNSGLYPNAVTGNRLGKITSLPNMDQRLRILKLLGTISAKHTRECTRNPQQLYVDQAKERYEPLIGHKTGWRSTGGLFGLFGGGASSRDREQLHLSDSRFSRRDVLTRNLMSLQGPDNHKYFFAINLYESFDVIPDLFSTLFKTASILGYHNVMVSIYENGSKDQTKALLRLFDALCRSVGMRVIIRSSARTRGQFNHRIEYLAEVRNSAMVPLHELRDQGDYYDSIVFMNDILPCVDDLLELIWQSRRQNAGITCAADYMYHDEIGSPVFYDNWVARDLNGTALENAPFEQVFHHTESSHRFQRHLPLQVQSCWNGVAVLDPAPFYETFPVKFRMAKLTENECSASECSLICNDYWAMGYGRIIMVPRVKLAYDKKVYDIIHPERRNLTAIRGYKRLGGMPDDPRSDPQDRSWYGPHDRLFTPEEDLELDFKPGPKSVWCWGWDGAGDLDGPDVDPIWEDQAPQSSTPEAVAIKHNRNLRGY
jgi:alpha-1,3-mannosyltransferase